MIQLKRNFSSLCFLQPLLPFAYSSAKIVQICLEDKYKLAKLTFLSNSQARNCKFVLPFRRYKIYNINKWKGSGSKDASSDPDRFQIACTNRI